MKLTFLISILSFTLFIGPANAQSRRDLKKMCKEVKKQCRADGGKRKECRQAWKECRKDNEVTFKDDLRLLKRTLADSVKISKGEDEVGEYYQVQIVTKKLAKIPEFSFSPEKVESKLEFVHSEGNQKLNFVVYKNDIYENVDAFPLQTSRGRHYPKFYDGRVFESVIGLPFIVGKNKMAHFYLDPENHVFGFYIEGDVSGNVFRWLNNLKNRVKWLRWIPDLNHVPFNVKVEKEKVGRMYALGYDDNGKNAGFLLLLDEEALFEVLE